MDKKKIIITAVSVVAIIAIAIIVSLLTKDTKTAYTISFNTDGGNKVASQQVEEGGKITKPANPTKVGYEFVGWYLNGKYFDFETAIEGNLTLDAKWKEIIKEEEKTDVNEEENKEEPKVEEEKEEDKKDEETTKVTKYTVKFDSKGGTSVSKQTVEKNKKVTKPADPTREGYKFLGWYLGSTKYNFSNKVTKNITLTAKWEKVQVETPDQPVEPDTPATPEQPVEPDTPVTPDQPDVPVTPEVKEYTVKFDVDGKVTTKIVKEGEKVTKPSNPTKDGYTFKYWSLNGAEYNFSNEVRGDITLKAEWKKNDVIAYEEVIIENSVANQVKIYVTLNGQRVAGTVEMTSTSGKKVTVDVPATGVIKTKGTYSSISNPKVK